MTPCLDPEQFYTQNYDHMHNFLRWKGVTNTMDREDIVQSFALRTLTTPRVLRDLVANDNERGSLTVRNLQCHMVQWYRDHPNRYLAQDNFYASVQSCFDTTSSWSDTSAVTSVNLACNDFLRWEETHPAVHGKKVSTQNIKIACDKIKAGEKCEPNQYWYKRFQRRRDLYKAKINTLAKQEARNESLSNVKNVG
jgi:hypothetical protein